jgi:hypothetical protein
MVRRAGVVILGVSLALSVGAGVALGEAFDAPKKDAPATPSKTAGKTSAKTPVGRGKTDAKIDSKPPAAK